MPSAIHHLALDHLAIVAPSLEDGVAHVRETLGVEMGPGGKHALMGTHNRLIRLGAECYLEVIAADPEAGPEEGLKRWFGLDEEAAIRRRWEEGRRLAAWVARVPDLDAAIGKGSDLYGQPRQLSRGSLTWRFGVRADGAIPADGAAPYLIEWPDGKGPASSMPESGLDLLRLVITCPDPAILPGAPPKTVYHQGGAVSLSAEIATSRGIVILR
jgi:hypothetical protein